MTSFRSLTMHEARFRQAAGGESIAQLNGFMTAEVAQQNPALGAFTHSFSEPCEPGHEHPLAGFSAAVKANIAGCGWPTHCGSRLLKTYRSPFDSTAVARLRQAGCGFSGITTMDEFGMGSSCENTTIGRVVNPWDHTRTAGGSSGGSAAAVAAGLTWFGLGSDTGGSVRLPAHFCGVVGLKPTWGLISRYGLVAFASSLDTIGILARDVEDAYAVFLVLKGPDAHDSTTLSAETDSRPLKRSVQLNGVRVGVPEQLPAMEMDQDVREDHEESCRLLRELGATLVPVNLACIQNAVPIYTVLNCAEASSNLHRYDGSLFGERESGETYQATCLHTRNQGFGNEVKRRLLLGAHVLSAGYRDKYYLRARAARPQLIQDFQRVFAEVHAIAMPTAPCTAFPLGSRLDDPLEMYSSDQMTVPASLAGLPALTLPTNLDHQGLPLSLQLIGPACSEKSLLEIALVLEKHLGFRQRKEAPWRSSL